MCLVEHTAVVGEQSTVESSTTGQFFELIINFHLFSASHKDATVGETIVESSTAGQFVELIITFRLFLADQSDTSVGESAGTNAVESSTFGKFQHLLSIITVLATGSEVPPAQELPASYQDEHVEIRCLSDGVRVTFDRITNFTHILGNLPSTGIICWSACCQRLYKC